MKVPGLFECRGFEMEDLGAEVSQVGKVRLLKGRVEAEAMVCDSFLAVFADFSF